MGKSPFDIATQIANEWNNSNTQLATATVINGFINFTLSNQALKDTAQFILENNKLPLKQVTKKTIFLDYGGANVAKELHIGHLRSTIIGETLKRLFEAFGHKTIGATYLGDWGLQMGLIIATIIERKIDVHEVTLDMLGEIYPEASKRKNEDQEFYERAADATLKLQNLQEPYYSMWKVLRDLSVKQIEKNFTTLGCTFDIYDGESWYQKNVSTVLDKLQKKKLLKESNGAMIVEVQTENDSRPMPPIVLKKQNGGDLYATSDLSAIYTRMQEYAPDTFVYITDARQSLHFEQVFRTARLGEFIKPETELLHIGFGTINNTDGKPFKTREGGSVKLEDIINIVTSKTTELAVGLSAMKFADLINTPHKDYIFDLEKFSSFEGKTGPYILYTIVRINSILNKAGTFNLDLSKLDKYITPTIHNIIVKIIKLTEAYSLSLNSLSVNAITEAVYNLAGSFSALYSEQNILAETDTDKRNFLLSIITLIKTSIKIGLNTLAIDTVEKM